MRIILAYPWTNPATGDRHIPDDAVDVAVHVGKQLVRDGKARPVGADLGDHEVTVDRAQARRDAAIETAARAGAEKLARLDKATPMNADAAPVEPAQTLTDSPSQGDTEGVES